MKKNKLDLAEKILSGFLILSLITIFISSVLTTYKVLNIQKHSYVLYGLGILGLIVIIYAMIKGKHQPNKIDIVVIFLILFGIISVIFSKDPKISLLGKAGRYEGLYSLMVYYIMFIISSMIKNNKLKEITINVILIFGALSVIYGLLQITDYSNRFMGSWLYAKGFAGNSIFFSSYNVMCLGLALGLYLFSTRKYYLCYVLIFSIGLVSTGAMSGLVGFIMILISTIIFMIYFKKTKQSQNKTIIKKSVAIILAFVIAYSFVAIIGRGHYNEDVQKVVNETITMVKDKKADDSFGTERLYIWRKTLEYAPKHLLHGVGIDMFMKIGDELIILPISHAIVDKAHNEYLQILVTEGIFALITYLSLLFMVFFNSLKRIFRKDNIDYLKIGLFLAFFGYIAQAFFNISVTRVAPIFFIIMGLLYDRDKIKRGELK